MEPLVKNGSIGKVAKIKNKLPSEVQITAEQLVQEANRKKIERRLRQKAADPEELAQLQLKKRKMFEDNIRKNRTLMLNWMKYAQWEQTQQEFDRARSIYERAFDVDYQCVALWLKYVEMEMKNKHINHARNIWDRAVTLLPHVDELWLKYAYMEETLGMILNARRIFERWMLLEPEEQAWFLYIKFEVRYKEVNKARSIYERLIVVHPETRNWLCYANFEASQGFMDKSRNIFERATEFFENQGFDEKLYIAFARFEESCQKYERSRTILKYALDKNPKPQAVDLFNAYSNFEKKYGDRRSVQDLVIKKCEFQYEDEVKANPSNYDAWFDYIRLLESNASMDSTRDVYKRAIANVPLIQEKRYWRQYIYIWINYALYEELIANDIDQTREVYKSCLKVIPHAQFTFGKVWLMYGKFEVRQKELPTARKILGTAIGKCPKPKLFKGYIELELQLCEFDRCRKIFEKYLEYDCQNSITWMKYADMEATLGNVERSRDIYNLAIDKVMNSRDERVMLIEAWLEFERDSGDEESLEKVKKKLPKKVEKRRKVYRDDGCDGWEEYWDYVFPDDSSSSNLKLLEMAKLWKQRGDD